MSFGIANTVQEFKPTIVEDAAWTIAEVVNIIQQAYDIQMEQFMKLTMEMLQKLVTAVGTPTNAQATPANNPCQCACQCSCQCVHCKHHHPKISDDKCWELETNAVNFSTSWYLSRTRPQQSPNGVWGPKSLSSGNQE